MEFQFLDLHLVGSTGDHMENLDIQEVVVLCAPVSPGPGLHTLHKNKKKKYFFFF